MAGVFERTVVALPFGRRVVAFVAFAVMVRISILSYIRFLNLYHRPHRRREFPNERISGAFEKIKTLISKNALYGGRDGVAALAPVVPKFKTMSRDSGQIIEIVVLISALPFDLILYVDNVYVNSV